MKTTIDQNGVLEIIPETPLEAYAIKKWTQENIVKDGRITTINVIIHTQFEETKHDK